MKKVLWVGDAGVPTGFARATHETLNVMKDTCDVTVLGLNYRGDPHDYPYPLYAAHVEGDDFGVSRIVWMCDRVKPDVIVIQQDPWNFKYYLDRLASTKEHAHVPVVGAVAVDGKNCRGAELNRLALGVFWTQFGLDEARKGGFTQPGVVIPLGVDTSMYYPTDKHSARLAKKLPSYMDDVFIVGNVNRNQPRKRWDLTIKYFAEWIRSKQIDDAWLYLHVAPTGDTGIDPVQLGRYYGITHRMAVCQPPTWYGDPDDVMRHAFNCFDVQLSTTQGEGFGLTTMEGMACGVPQIVPDWAALGDLCEGAATLVPCTSTAIGPPYVNVIGGVMDEALAVAALDAAYTEQRNDPAAWETRRALGLARVQEERFQWPVIGQQFTDAVSALVR